MAKKKTSPRRHEYKPRGEPIVRKVLEVTLEHLATRGFHALSVPEIATEAGLNKTSIYRRWPTKVELVREALQASLGHDEPLPDTGNVRTDMLLVAERALRFSQSPMGLSVLRMMMAESADPELSDFVSGMFKKLDRHGPREVLERAIARGEFEPGTDVRLVLSVFAGTILHRILIEQSRMTKPQLERLVDMVLHGILKKSERESGEPERTLVVVVE